MSKPYFTPEEFFISGASYNEEGTTWERTANLCNTKAQPLLDRIELLEGLLKESLRYVDHNLPPHEIRLLERLKSVLGDTP